MALGSKDQKVDGETLLVEFFEGNAGGSGLIFSNVLECVDSAGLSDHIGDVGAGVGDIDIALMESGPTDVRAFRVIFELIFNGLKFIFNILEIIFKGGFFIVESGDESDPFESSEDGRFFIGIIDDIGDIELFEGLDQWGLRVFSGIYDGEVGVNFFNHFPIGLGGVTNEVDFSGLDILFDLRDGPVFWVGGDGDDAIEFLDSAELCCMGSGADEDAFYGGLDDLDFGVIEEGFWDIFCGLNEQELLFCAIGDEFSLWV